ncbi:MAG: hypothetical protein HZA93_14970 [Verrucomicrobia bacterium]|nr:hypothetical protein [Verrucomicrobiota bacterium]
MNNSASSHPPVGRVFDPPSSTRGPRRAGHRPALLTYATVALTLAFVTAAHAQSRPYIGYAYPAGGQVGTTVSVRIGGQELDEASAVLVTGSGVTGTITACFRRLNNQEIQLLREQLTELRRNKTPDDATKAHIARIERRIGEWVQQPACASIASLVMVDLTISPDAEPGPRELRVLTPRGVSCPLVFQIGQLPETARKPMLTAPIQILGKEAQALRKRPPAEGEVRLTLPGTANGQIASGEINRYRFAASQGQRLVVAVQARALVPFIADAVPGWFQPVLKILDAQGREVAYNDDFRFKPDPVIVFEVPQDGDYVIAIHDSLFRGREDFVYRLTAGELPFVTSVFPLGGQIGTALPPSIGGINVSDADLAGMTNLTQPGVRWLAASRLGVESNRVPFALEPLPDTSERESNDTPATAQPITLPVVVNGRIDRTDDWDVYQFTGRAGQSVVVEVEARRLDSPLDSIVKLTDATGKVIAFNDDREDPVAGLNTHHADSYFLTKLPADGAYFVHIGDTARKGGGEYGYRLRISGPRPDFALRVVPSSLTVPVNGTGAVTVYVDRRDGFAGPVKLALANPPAGFSAQPATIPANQNNVRLALRGAPKATTAPVTLAITGSARIADKDLVRDAVAAEDRMQAFLWRQLVPARDFQMVVFDRNNPPAPKRVPPERPAVAASPADASAPAANAAAKQKFTKQQIAGRLRQLRLLYEEGLLSDPFYLAKVAECDAAS